MAKVILEIEEPGTCEECPCYNGEYNLCQAAEGKPCLEWDGEKGGPVKGIFCPLKPMK